MEQEPVLALSRFFYVCAALLAPVAIVAHVLLKRRMGRAYDSGPEASTGEILDELDREFTRQPSTTIRTQTEYLPYLLECIRENLDSGFEDPQMISLLQRIENLKPGEQRGARFTVVSRHQPGDLHFRWVRDSCDRIVLQVQGAPRVIRALKEHKRRIPKAALV